MSARIILVITLLVGVATGIAASALGFTSVLVQIATAITFAILVGSPLLWWRGRKGSQEEK